MKHLKNYRGGNSMIGLSHSIVIKTGRHQHPSKAPNGAQKLLEELFFHSDFVEPCTANALLGERIKGSGDSKEIEVRSADSKKKKVIVLIKPGDNGSRHKYYLSMPEGYRGSLEDFFQVLAEGKIRMSTAENKEPELVLEDLEVATSEKGDDTMRDEKQKTADFLAPPPESPTPPTPTDTPKRRLVAKILNDETIVRIILHEIGETEKVLQKRLLEKIDALGLNLDSRQVIHFLEKKGYIERDQKNKMVSFFSLSQKGKELMGTAEEKNPVPETSQSSVPEKKMSPSELELLAKEHEAIKAKLEEAISKCHTAKEKVSKAQEEWQAEQDSMEAIKKDLTEVKEKMLAIMS